jgi:hypothetical protein
MKWKYKKINLIIICILITVLLNGCVVSKEASIKASTELFFTSIYNTLNFIKTNNYQSEEISGIKYDKQDDIHSIGFILKEDINVSMSFDANKLVIEGSIVAKNNANVEDLINCANFILNYEERENNYSILKDSINEALKKEGEKKEIPLLNNPIVGYVQVLDGTVYIIFSAAI